MNSTQGRRAGVATIWFVTAAEPLAVLTAEPDHDRGFGRKYLALLDPRLTVTPIGDFPLNRSAPAGAGEFYIGGFDGLAVVQTVLDDVSRLSDLPGRYLRGIAATDVYAFASDPDTGFGAFAHWRAGELKRAFSATRFTIIEDIGVPDVFEGDFWAGRRKPEASDEQPAGGPRRGVAMPFVPAELADAAAEAWLGFDPADPGPDIPVSAFAIDGRRASAQEPVTARRARATRDIPHPAAGEIDYDDYEDHSPRASEDPAEGLRKFGRAAADGARSLGEGIRGLGKKAWATIQKRNRS
ncbi:DUF6928 family protein [Corynebacterium freneyi]|uniref:Uncharacterized protein n=1 Tax=Corynebacterium freneyi TaxID=134034 RepID=A0ABS4U554_9CORY|nr:hypothetical protein [Corynebacterium freneyi]MBP2331772.1 hypothetical protein [Corynebacterium freneyi]QXA51788.1 hypothetical protein I6L56_06385 [Corynebacterium freneyi]WJZ06107.1 hypothetical protein CFREN_10805 [Corynebacterium freneyi]